MFDSYDVLNPMLIISSIAGTLLPAWVAADMLSQAEHAPGCAYLFTVSQKIAEEVLKELKKQVEGRIQA
ncbi:unnamed protein product, partial [marine sediment metagenome]